MHFFVSVYLKNSPIALDSPQKSTHHGPQGCIQASVGIMQVRFYAIKLVNFIVIGIFINKNTYIIPTGRVPPSSPLPSSEG